MKPLFITALLLLLNCGDYKFFYYQPANPPSGVEISMLGNGDYLLIFYSENRNNQRFGGFMLFMSQSQEDLLNMQSPGEASDLLIGQGLNLGIDTPAAVLFSDDVNYESVISGYAVSMRRPKNIIVPGELIMLRAFLYDDYENIIEVSASSNVAQVP